MFWGRPVNWKRLSTALVVSCIAHGVWSTGAAAKGAKAGTLGVVIENDSVTPSDREYSSGVKPFFISEAGKAKGLARLFLRAGDAAETRYGVAVGQSIFTPTDLQATTPAPGDRPYAGGLYTEFSLYAKRRSGALDILSADLGVVGPDALAEQAQNTLHRIIGAQQVRGYANQLRDEPGLVLSFDRLWRASTGPRGFGADLTPSLGASVGNVLTEARTGLTVRVGYNLGDGYGPARIRPALANAGFIDAPGPISVSAFAGVYGRAVVRNIFLDGNTFRQSLAVDKRAFGGDGQAGLSLRLWRIEGAATYVWRAKEYETQGAAHRFGALTVSGRF